LKALFGKIIGVTGTGWAFRVGFPELLFNGAILREEEGGVNPGGLGQGF